MSSCGGWTRIHRASRRCRSRELCLDKPGLPNAATAVCVAAITARAIATLIADSSGRTDGVAGLDPQQRALAAASRPPRSAGRSRQPPTGSARSSAIGRPERGRHPVAGVFGEGRARGPGDADVKRRMTEAQRSRGRGRIAVDAVGSAGNLDERIRRQRDAVIDHVVGVGRAQAQVIPGVHPGDARQDRPARSRDRPAGARRRRRPRRPPPTPRDTPAPYRRWRRPCGR